jgi:hypothetical protein
MLSGRCSWEDILVDPSATFACSVLLSKCRSGDSQAAAEQQCDHVLYLVDAINPVNHVLNAMRNT